MQSSRWAPVHRRGASIAPSTNAAILDFKAETAAAAAATAASSAAATTATTKTTTMTMATPSVQEASVQETRPPAPTAQAEAVQQAPAKEAPAPSPAPAPAPAAARAPPLATLPAPTAPSSLPAPQTSNVSTAPKPPSRPAHKRTASLINPQASAFVPQSAMNNIAATYAPPAPRPIPSTVYEYTPSPVAPVFVPAPEYHQTPMYAPAPMLAPMHVPVPMQEPTPVATPDLEPDNALMPGPAYVQPLVDNFAAEPIHAIPKDPPPPMVVQEPLPPVASQDPLPPVAGPEPYSYGDPYGQTGGETSDLFFGDDFTPIARPVPQPVVQPAPVPAPAPAPAPMSVPVHVHVPAHVPEPSIEPQLQQIDAASKDLPPIHQFQTPRVAREPRRGRGRGRGGEVRGRGEGRGRGRGRAGRGRGGRGGQDGYANTDVPTNGLPEAVAEKAEKTSPPAAESNHNTQNAQADVADTAKDSTQVEATNNAPTNAPTGPAQPGPTPAVKGDRSATGGIRRPKLTEEELSAKLAAVRLRNEEREKAHRAAAEDEAKFRAQEQRAKEEAAEKRKEEQRERRELMQEREKNRLRKMKNMGVREWDEGKESAGLLEGTGRNGYGNGFRGRGHYRRGANGAIAGFNGRTLMNFDNVEQDQTNGDAPVRDLDRDDWRSGNRGGRGGGGRGGRGGFRKDPAAEFGRGRGRGRGRGGRGGGGEGNHGAPGLNVSEFPALGGDKTKAARAAVEQASKQFSVSRKASLGNPVTDVKSPTTADYATILNHGNSNGIGKGHSRRSAIDETRIASWADQVEEAM